MNGRQLAALFEEHGGIKTVHVHPHTDKRKGQRGWANTIECHDGFRRTLTRAEERSLNETLKESKDANDKA
jgi:hypothetical protein